MIDGKSIIVISLLSLIHRRLRKCHSKSHIFWSYSSLVGHAFIQFNRRGSISQQLSHSRNAAPPGIQLRGEAVIIINRAANIPPVSNCSRHTNLAFSTFSDSQVEGLNARLEMSNVFGVVLVLDNSHRLAHSRRDIRHRTNHTCGCVYVLCACILVSARHCTKFPRQCPSATC